jgi:hypothetical protein
MAIAIQPFTEDRVSAVKTFNERLAAGGIPSRFHFPDSDVPDWLPKENGSSIYQEYYLAVDGADVHGGFILKHQEFSVAHQTLPIVHYRLPVSEGIVNRQYANVAVVMQRVAMKMEPLLFALGMGGFDRPLPKMLKATGWRLSAVPFYFRVHHPIPFLRQIGPLRRSLGRRVVADLAAVTGTGWLGIKALHRLRTASGPRGVEATPVNEFGSWADELWQRSCPHYEFIGDRRSDTLNALYPPGERFLRYKLLRGSETLGWVVVLDTQMQDNQYFGNLRVGTLADCLAAPENAPAVVHAATAVLEKRGVDLIISNHSHAAWGDAFRSAGYLLGPSNFIFAASKPLAERLGPFETNRYLTYIMRGDGDGPVNL